MKKVHQMMRDYRESKGVSQSHIARKTGKTSQRISALENGNIRLTADEFVDICVNGFEISPAIFFTIALSENENCNIDLPSE